MTLEGDLFAIERRVLVASQAGQWLDAVDALRDLFAQGEIAGLRNAVLALNAPLIEGEALAAVAEAFGLGRDDALSLIDADKPIVKRVSKSLPTAVARNPLRGIDRAGEIALAQAQKLALAGADEATFLSPVFGHANSMRGRVTESVVRGGNEGVTRVADVTGLPTVWVAETNACVHCLAYSGEVSQPGVDFPGGLTYGKKSYFPNPLPSPPLHPNCRCHVEPLNDQSFADALRREADRSILRGFSLQSESMSVRVDAAGRLLDRGVDAPKSVLAYARSAVKRGSFTTRDR